CGISDSILRHLIYVRKVAQLGSVAAVIGQTQTGIETEIALDRKIPLLDVRVFIVQVHQVREALRPRLRQVGRERVWEIQRGLSAPERLIVGPVVGSRQSPAQARDPAQQSFKVPAVASSNDRTVVREWTPSESNARSKIGFLRIAHRLRNAGLSPCQYRHR